MAADATYLHEVPSIVRPRLRMGVECCLVSVTVSPIEVFVRGPCDMGLPERLTVGHVIRIDKHTYTHMFVYVLHRCSEPIYGSASKTSGL